jgi:hypothetical protein
MNYEHRAVWGDTAVIIVLTVYGGAVSNRIGNVTTNIPMREQF